MTLAGAMKVLAAIALALLAAVAISLALRPQLRAALLAELRQDFASLGDTTRRSALLLPLITVLSELEKTWGNTKAGAPTQSMVASTHERLRTVMEELTLK